MKAESITAPTLKGGCAGRPTGRRLRNIWDIRQEVRWTQERKNRVRAENKRVVWIPEGSQEGIQSRKDSKVETGCLIPGERDRQRQRMGWIFVSGGLVSPASLAYLPACQPHLPPLPLQRCEEVEAMKGQVSQEQELRAVVESCLLEQDGTRKDVFAQLQETWALVRDAALILDQLR